MVREMLRRALRYSGFEAGRRSEIAPRESIHGACRHIAGLGVVPRTIIDVGAADGTDGLYGAFPEAELLLVEPLEEFRKSMQAILRTRRGVSEVLAASSKEGERELNVHPVHLQGSSMLQESMGGFADGYRRVVRTARIDTLVRRHKLAAPFLVKVDVQGAELDVLEGSTETLSGTQVVIVEVSLFRFLKDGPDLADVVEYMRGLGFVTYDILRGWCRPLDGALAQVDLVFVQEHGVLRQSHAYATEEQYARLFGRAER